MSGWFNVKDICVRFGGLIAVNHVTFDVEKHSITGLIGPNGAGKSTVLNVVSGFQSLAEGAVHLNGVRLDKYKPDKIARMGLARTFQAGRLFSELTVEENINSGAFASGKSGADVRRTTAEIADKLGITRLLNGEPASALPYTDQRRVTIARALSLSPSLLCLDEPAAGMSDGEITDFMQTISGLPQAFDCAVLLIEHNMELVMNVCERIYVMDSGRLIADGTPREVQANRQVIDAYLG